MKLPSVKRITLNSLNALKKLFLDISQLKSSLQPDFSNRYSNDIEEFFVKLDSLNVSFDYSLFDKKLVCSFKSNNNIDFGPIYTIRNKIEKLRINKSNIDSNKLFSIVCNNFKNLFELEIFDCIIYKIEKKMFDGLSNLRSLRLYSNRNNVQPIMIDYDAYSHLKQLVNLDLSRNSFESFDKRIFSELFNLEILDLCGNWLKSLDENIFSNLKNLRELYLRSNYFDAFDHRLFAGLENLYELHLPDNKSLCFDSRILDCLPRLKKIILSRRSISHNETEILNRFQQSRIHFEFY